ncbi:MAG: DUF3494 domain-containing protein [Flavobacteriales bacterium]|nr:DUF3494 domain-containing protein [Flavobacteriales bacterium]
MNGTLRHLLIAVTPFFVPLLSLGQTPVLGTTSDFALFTAVGAFSNDGATVVTGDIGTNVGAFTGFPPGTVIGTIHVADGASAQAATDVAVAFGSFAAITCGQVIGTTMGSGQILTPDVYCLGAASTLVGELILDAEGDPNATFIFKIDGALSTATLSSVTLINGASLCNVYWQVNGQFEQGAGSTFRGTVVVNGAIILLEGADLYGRAVSQAGAIELHNNIVTMSQQPFAADITAGGAVSFCVGGSVVLSGNLGGTWSTGATTPAITVTTSGDFYVTNSNDCGTDTSNVITVTVNPLPVCAITGDLVICEGGSSELCVASGASSYLWSTGATTSCITVSAAGNYSVVITDGNGCSSTCNVTVDVTSAPVCSITGGLTICEGATTELCAPAGASSYLWSNGATTACITVSTAGAYSVTVTNAGGCSSTCNATVVVTGVPTCSITGGLTICEGATTELCAPAGASSYLWSNGATTACITVSAAGDYSVTVTNPGGCSSTCNATVVVTGVPVCTITGGLTICEGATTELCAPAGASSYLWSNGATTACITVSAAGDYSVTVTNPGGCSSTCNATVVVTGRPRPRRAPPPPPLSGARGSAGTGTQRHGCCDRRSGLHHHRRPRVLRRRIDAVVRARWCCQLPLEQRRDDQLHHRQRTGPLPVEVTYAGGCSSSCEASVIENPLPICAITGGLILCEGGSTELCATGTGSYLWSTGATTSCITVNSAGIYSVTITSPDGCESNCEVEVIINPLPICSITGGLVLCEGATSELCATGTGSYLWSTGATTSCITVSTAGIYSVTITSPDGCSSTCEVEVEVTTTPICTITGGLVFCEGGSTELCVPAGAVSYLWSNGATTNCITVSAPGLYSVEVTYAGGCSSSCEASVIENPLPICAITGGLVLCEGGSTELCATGTGSYLWSTGATTSCITVNTAGVYSVTITSPDGCESNCQVTVVVNPLPICSITGGLVLCEGATSELCATGTGSYLWSTGATTSCITVSSRHLLGHHHIT